MAEHVKEVKKTIKDLSAKKYYKKFQTQGDKIQPDYTLMFVYPESALLAAVEADPDILSEAWKNNIALVSATSLMSTLKMVSKLWDIDKQHEYMDELKEDILKLMEKFNDFLVNFAKAEQAVSNAAEAVKIARGHIDGNKGALLPVAQRIADIYEVQQRLSDFSPCGTETPVPAEIAGMGKTPICFTASTGENAQSAMNIISEIPDILLICSSDSKLPHITSEFWSISDTFEVKRL